MKVLNWHLQFLFAGSNRSFLILSTSEPQSLCLERSVIFGGMCVQNPGSCPDLKSFKDSHVNWKTRTCILARMLISVPVGLCLGNQEAL